jgi:hypothetical protein
MRNLSGLLTLFFCSLFPAEGEESFVPVPVAKTDFSSLTEMSPFTRSINLSDSLILTGMAMVDDEQVATLLNKETKETYVVSSKLNSQGWKMVEVKANEDLEKVAAKVSVDGGEVVTVRYGEWQLKPGESKPGAGASEGGGIRPGGDGRRGDGDGRRGDGDGRRGDGDGRRGPPPEMREKMAQLSEEQRGKLFQKMMELREKNPDMPREERGKIMMEAMNKMIEKK